MTTINLDNRGLDPPEPMVRILSAVHGLRTGDEVVALLDRDPLLLYAELERRGLTWDLTENEEDYTLKIWRLPAPEGEDAGD